MESKKLRTSLTAISLLAVALIGLSFFANEAKVVRQPVQDIATPLAYLEIDFGDRKSEIFTAEVDGTKNLLQVMEESLRENEIIFTYESYPGIGELVTQIGGKKNGDENKYWQFWINGEYSMVGVSSYMVMGGDLIKWKFTDEIEE